MEGMGSMGRAAVALALAVAALARAGALTAEQEARVRRMLAPMPQELRFDGGAVSAPASQWRLASEGAATEEREALADFRAWWKETFGAELAAGGAGPRIVAGVVAGSAALQEAARQGWINARHLAARPNADQAYWLCVRRDAAGPVVCVAANAPAGLRFGLQTLRQLLAASPPGTLPCVEIVDWPRIAERGLWHAAWVAMPEEPGAAPETPSRRLERWLRRFAAMKLNHIILTAAKVNVAPDGLVSVSDGFEAFKCDALDMGRRLGMAVWPRVHHLDQMLAENEALRKAYPGLVGVKAEGAIVWPMCYSNPQTQAFLDALFAAVARGLKTDTIVVWLSEIEGPAAVCQCPKCGGDPRRRFVAEARHVARAFEKARAARPGLRLLLTLSQGSYPFNLDVADAAPKDATLLFYHGQMTYKTDPGELILPPSVTELQGRGFRVGAVTMLAESHMHKGYLMVPFLTPRLARERMSEMGDRGMAVAQVFAQPNLAVPDLDIQAAAEFAWNGAGRSTEEFVASWAARRGSRDPEAVARVVSRLEYPARALSAAMQAGRMENAARVMADMVTGRRVGAAGKQDPLWGFEFPAREEVARQAAACRESAALASAAGEAELAAGARFLAQWMDVFERYAFVLEQRDAARRKEGVAGLMAAVDGLRPARDAWVARLPLVDYHRRIAAKEFDNLLAVFETIRSGPPPAVKAEVEALSAAERQGGVVVAPLSNAWRFRADPRKEGADKGWAGGAEGAGWAVVRSDTGAGWESQGFAGYVGVAWYRQAFSTPRAVAARKHAYLYFGGVDEDAEVFVDGKPAFAHNDKTTGLAPGATWNVPFCFDAKALLKPGAESVIAVRVFNRAGMGGVWQPAFLVACDAEVSAQGIREFLAGRGR